MSKWGEMADRVLADIALHQGAPGAQTKIAERTDMTATAVGICLRNLKKAGKITIAEQGSFRKANTYNVLAGPEPEEISDADLDSLIEEGVL